ncbi:hypothetical protein E8E13_002567 [Curvularia kusanoi]|uniref:Azaphilone pigments biosynthesis cluster protein L N-terminal domain-containing protein n=1 Tax=Curvularia kusanoi TaxID=90978 RepID=A0A9P4WDE1_CURKU|nr:hypothetical protein E8E13_002567 [Curvularia kusanoi]
MDPLSITASVVGIAMATLQSLQILKQTIENIKDAPATLKDLSYDLSILSPILDALLETVRNRPEQIVLNEQIVRATASCNTACTSLQSQMYHWTKHSTKEKMFWYDKWKVGLFGLERIKAFRGQIEACKNTLNVALSTSTVLTTCRQGNLMQEMKDMMLQQNEVLLKQQISRAGAEFSQVSRDMQLVTRSTNDRPNSTSTRVEALEESKDSILLELSNLQSAHQNCIRACEEALAQTVNQRTGVKVKGLRASNHGKNITGFINTSKEESRIDLDISDVVADTHGINVAGVVNGFDFRDLRS